MPKTCPHCSATNPSEAAYCFRDGNPLDRPGTNGTPRAPGAQHFLTPFVFPTGQVCHDFDQLALACQQQWAAAVTLLRDGQLERFFGKLGRIDLVQAARAAAGFPDGDRGLDQLLSRLPTQRLDPPHLHVAATDMHLGIVPLGSDRQFDLRLVNRGMRLLYGTVSSDCEWLGFSDRRGASQKLFRCGDEAVVRVHLHGKELRAGAKDLVGRLSVETNGGNETVTVRVTVPAKPFPSGALAGATSPRQVAEKAKQDPAGAAALFESGAVARWFADNGWKYPVQGAAANGVAAVQQFFEALGLTRPPKVTLSEATVRLEAEPGSSVKHTLYVRTEEKRHVFAEARSDQAWLKVHRVKSKGAIASIRFEATAPANGGPPLQARVHVRANGDQHFEVPFSLTVSNGGGWRVAGDGKKQKYLPATRHTSPATILKHLAPLAVLWLCLLGIAARDHYGFTPSGPEVIVEESDPPAPVPSAPEPLKVAVEDGEIIFTRENVSKISHKIEDEPEERNSNVPRPAPIKVAIRDEPEERPTARKELPVDPEPRIAYRYDPDQRFGVRTVKDRAGGLLNKKLTYQEDGTTNNARIKVDGRDLEFGRPPGKWLSRGEPIPPDPERKTKAGTVSVYQIGDIEVNQTLEIVPSRQPAEVEVEDKKVLKYLLDTLLVRYEIENKGKAVHTAGLRVQVDTQIGDNDAAPFTIPGVPGLCMFRANLQGKQLPDFIQALEKPDLRNPGLVAHMTLKLGGKMEPPGRVCLARWESWQAQGGAPWETKFLPFMNLPNQRDDSAVYLYWDEKPLKPGQKRQFGFAYGLGSLDAGEGDGKLGITLDGSFEPGQSFTVTAYAVNPVSGQKLTLEVPDGLKPEGKATVSVPKAAGNPPTSVVTWKVKVLRTGEFRLCVRSSTGLAQSKTISIQQGEALDPGRLALKLVPPFEPGKAFAVEADATGPAPDQKLRLELPDGVERVAGEEEQVVAKAGDGETKQVRWKVKVKEVGVYRIGVRSSTGIGRAKTLTIVKTDAGGDVRVALQGDIEPGKAFSVLAKVEKPAPDQKLTLLLPDELERVGGDETQPVPPDKKEAATILWKVKVLKTGKYTLRVRSSTGVTYPKTITLTETRSNLGRFELAFDGDITPGKDFRVVATVKEPAPKQELKLTLPPGIQLMDGVQSQPVPPSQDAGASVTWTVRVVERGRLPVRVDSSTGIARTRTITISGGGDGPGQIFGK
jgi:hypothetical protein